MVKKGRRGAWAERSVTHLGDWKRLEEIRGVRDRHRHSIHAGVSIGQRQGVVPVVYSGEVAFLLS